MTLSQAPPFACVTLANTSGGTSAYVATTLRTMRRTELSVMAASGLVTPVRTFTAGARNLIGRCPARLKAR